MTRKLDGAFPRVLLGAAGAEGNGDSPASPPPPPPPAPAPAPKADESEAFRAALKKYGDDATGLARESWANAERSRLEVESLRAKAPKEGSVVLDGDDLAEWNAFRGLGRKAAEVKGDLDKLPGLEGQLSAIARRDHIAAAAGAAGSDGRPLGYSPKVLGTLAGDGLRIEVVDKKVNGRDAKVAEVVEAKKDDKGADVEARTPLDRYAEAHWPEFLASLRQAPARPALGTPPASVGQPTPRVKSTPGRPPVALPRV